MERPVIGVTTYARNAAGSYALPAEYVAAVLRAGGLPLLIAAVWEPGLASHYLKRLDGLVLAGGGDLDPAGYGGRPHETMYEMDPDRDRLELDLVRELLRHPRPTLAVCRGMQLVNVALGGTLIEHLPDEVGEAVRHRQPPRDAVPHAVRLHADSRLAAILATTEICPMSWHHQGIRSLGAGLTAVAHAPDGTIEALELESQPALVAVQWHPELTAHEDATQQRLFDHLVEQAHLGRAVVGRCA
jgi:putative glutamine amidotransferase